MSIARITCSLCEACCGAIAHVEEDKIVRVSPDLEDTLSGGFICAKGAAIPELEADPDRIRNPLIRVDGVLRPASWDEAFAYIDRRFGEIIAQHGRNAVGVYVGNASAHNLSIVTYFEDFMLALGSTNFYSAGSVDQIPRQVVSGLLYGDDFSVTVPDIDRSQLVWIIGANPAESNGSLIVAPGFLGRMQALRARGGRIVVIDPRRTMTAKRADEYVAIRPSADAAFLAAVANVILSEGQPRSKAGDLCRDLDRLDGLFAPFTPERVANLCGTDAATIRRLALELLTTPAAAVYGRMGTTTQLFSSLVCWLIDVVNILAGNLDVEGGAMFPKPLHAHPNSIGVPGKGLGFTTGRWTSRVRNAPEMISQLPVACLAEEIETPGPGQMRALITFAGNPVVSSPETKRLQAALDRLELIVSLDIYVNETTSKAHVVLPSPPRLTKPMYDLFLYRFAVRSYGRYTNPYRSLTSLERSDREIMLRLTAIAAGLGWDADIDDLDAKRLREIVVGETARLGSAVEGKDPDTLLSMMDRLSPLERRMDLGLRTGPFGDGFGSRRGITFDDLRDAEQGLDLGPMVPRLPEVLRTLSGRIELLHPIFAEELTRLDNWVSQPKPKHVLVGRRQLRSNNSWMHNLNKLQHRTRRCTAQMNMADSAELGLEDGDLVELSTTLGRVSLPVEITEDIAPGVVSVPHGWGHAGLTETMNVAAAEPGININEIIDFKDVDPLTWTARVNGVPITVTKKTPVQSSAVE